MPYAITQLRSAKSGENEGTEILVYPGSLPLSTDLGT